MNAERIFHNYISEIIERQDSVGFLQELFNTLKARYLKERQFIPFKRSKNETNYQI
ncbi:hypothetical protein [uncultured Clostridium sp.]|uniref:hypothetical protein n=1 Tax=uncultured Clostridium sp. TaxID=59620 RepID=UPI0026217D2C|nr:hypothetical protein [uncultured Clostridium sp.]